MANTSPKEIPLKFTKNDFWENDTPSLLINVWTYNYYKPHCEKCPACKIYCDWSVEILKETWKEEWGDMSTAIKKILKNDENFVNINWYSTDSKWGIIDELIIKKIKRNFFFWFNKRRFIKKNFFFFSNDFKIWSF